MTAVIMFIAFIGVGGAIGGGIGAVVAFGIWCVLALFILIGENSIRR